MRTLWVEAIPKEEHSLSSALAEAFLDAAPAAAVGEVQRFSVGSGRDAAIAKFAPLLGERRTPEQKQLWSQILAEIDRVRGFDTLVVEPTTRWTPEERAQLREESIARARRAGTRL